jgi:predicted nucleic acid-binding protein
MKVVVPDASVILKWVLPDPTGEQDVESALHLRDSAVNGKISIKVPSLWLYEVGNTLTRRFADRAQDLLDALVAFDLDESGMHSEWLDQTITLTRRYNVTFYDAVYHALALVEKGVFVTADAKYVRKAGKAGAVVALKEWAGLG